MNYKDTFWKEFNHKHLIDLERFRRYYESGEIPFPRFSNIYLSAACYHNCSYCEYKNEGYDKMGFKNMSFENYKKICDELYSLNVRAIDYCGGGECLCNNEFSEIIRYTKKKGMVIGLFTNLSTMKYNQDIADCCSYVRISLDSFRPETYNKMRKPNNGYDLDATLKSIKDLISRKHNGMIIGLKQLITKENYDQVEEFIVKSIEMGADSVQFKKVMNSPETEITPEQIDDLNERFNVYRKHYGDKIDIIQNFSNLEVHFQCFTSVNHVFIDVDGSMYLCCYYIKRMEKHKYGNAITNGVVNSWFGPEHHRALKRVDFNECNYADCRWIKANNACKPLLDDPLGQIKFV